MLTASPSERLWHKIHLAQPALHAASDSFWRADNLRALFPQFLIQLHHVVTGGLRLMSFAAEQAESAQAESIAHDEVARIAATYLRHHIAEERDHADWLLADLAVLGIDAQAVAATPPLRGVISLLGEQFFWIASFHPATVFGYLLVLEGTPPIVEQLDEIRDRTGLPADAFRCLRSHAEDDPAHLEDLNRTLDQMPLTEQQERRLGLSAFGTIEAVCSILTDLQASAPRAHASGQTVLAVHG